jgi:hypothetical protein
MDLPDASLNLPGPTAPETVADWNEAYVTVESYFCALGLRNKLLLSTCIHRVLKRAAARHDVEATRKPSAIAMEEAMRLVAEWFQRVLDIQLPENRLAARGRLSLLLADLPGHWQPWFLSEPPWPAPFVAAMRNSYLSAGPEFQTRTMTPRPIEISPLLSGASRSWDNLSRTNPHLKRALAALIGLAVLGAIYLLLGS